MAAKTSLHLTGRQTDKDRLPALLQSASRSAGTGEAEDLFLPAGYLQTRACFEVAALRRVVSAGPRSSTSRPMTRCWSSNWPTAAC
jgi:hypothetical protein